MSRPPPLSDAVIAEGTEENEVEVDLSTLMFIDRGWLEHHTMNAFMNPSGLMDYFCQRHNPFYDERSNNEKLRGIQSRMAPGQQIDAAAQLQTMRGIEYSIGLDTAQAAVTFSPAEGHSWLAEKAAPKLPDSDQFRANPYTSRRKDLTEEHVLHDQSQKLLHELVARFPAAPAASMPPPQQQQQQKPGNAKSNNKKRLADDGKRGGGGGGGGAGRATKRPA
eukprot:gene1031-18913_t